MIRPVEVGTDRMLVGAVLLLMAFGMVMVFSSGAVFAARKYGDATYFLKRELVYAVLGLGAMTLALRTDYSVYRRLAYPLLGVSIVALAAVLKLGSRAGGAIRWFRLGPLSFQPGELAKLALCIYLASLLARKAEKVRVFSVGFLPPLVVTGVMMGLLLKQPDLGTAVIFGAVALGLLFVAGTRTSYLIIAVLVAAPAGWKFIVSTPFRMRRMLAFLDPWAFRRDVGYQITESLISVGSGGLTGLGLGDGRQKLFFLPEAHTDFILSIVGEELGLVGVLCVVARLLGAGVARAAGGVPRARRCSAATWRSASPRCSACRRWSTSAWCWARCRPRGCRCRSSATAARRWWSACSWPGVLGNISARNPEPGAELFDRRARPRHARAQPPPRRRAPPDRRGRAAQGGGRQARRRPTRRSRRDARDHRRRRHRRPPVSRHRHRRGGDVAARAARCCSSAPRAGSRRKLVPDAGFPLELLEVSGLKRTGVRGLLRGLLRLPKAFFAIAARSCAAFARIWSIGVGGYASGPIVLAAALSGYPTAIQEQNSRPGFTNRLLGQFVRRVFVAFEESRKYFAAAKTTLSGNPVRRRFLDGRSAAARRRQHPRPRRCWSSGAARARARSTSWCARWCRCSRAAGRCRASCTRPGRPT